MDLDLEARQMAEKFAHRKKHAANYEYYNSIFGDLLEKKREWGRRRYWNDPEHTREMARKRYQKHRASTSKRQPNERYLPECRFQCGECPHDDCVVPEDWYKQNYNRQYCAEHREQRAEYNKQYYSTHREAVREKQRRYREKNREAINARRRAQWANKTTKKETSENGTTGST
ncbi:MAG: hypothetical protein IJX67_00755 [Oscillospiraceae bacterium]|nr:hypothetical protein [Oscillospiraceae bacterium]